MSPKKEQRRNLVKKHSNEDFNIEKSSPTKSKNSTKKDSSESNIKKMKSVNSNNLAIDSDDDDLANISKSNKYHSKFNDAINYMDDDSEEDSLLVSKKYEKESAQLKKKPHSKVDEENSCTSKDNTEVSPLASDKYEQDKLEVFHWG